MRKFAAAAAAVGLSMTLTGCGSGGSDVVKGDKVDLPGTSLAIIVTVDKGATPKVYTLDCDPAGGNHPQPAEACAALKKAGAAVFEPVPKSQICSQLYGGPQTANVRGSYEGKHVNASFKRTNGCEVDRWEKLGTTFFDVPLQ